MVIISDYRINAIGDSEYQCESHEAPTCPCCGEPLFYRNRRKRIMKTYGGVESHIWVRRLKCKKCNKLHTELPDCLVPYKHYATEVIENVVDEVMTEDDDRTEEYPCEETMHIWKEWIGFNTVQIEGMLRSIGNRFLDLSEALLTTADSIFGKLRENGAGWLSICERAIYNTGGKFLTKPAHV